MKIAFICVNYNNSKITQEYIENVLDINKDYDVQIIVVDNASQENDIQELSTYIEDLKNDDVILIKSKTNVGYFKGLNLGINYIDTSEYDWVVIGNNDLIFDSSFNITLASKKIEKDVFVIAPNIIRIDGVHQNPHIVLPFSWIQKVYRKIYYSNYYLGLLLQATFNIFKSKIISEDRKGNEMEQIILMGYGACYLLTKNFFKVYKELEAVVFLMGEEGVLANQVLKANGVTLYCPELVVHHHDHTSISKVPSKKLYEFNKIAYEHFIKNCKYVH